MMRILAVFILVLAVSACASPTFQMSPEQIASLSDDQICNYKNNYRDETKLELEIARRGGLNCNRFYRECLNRGNAPGTEAMAFCMDMVQENERLRYERSAYDWDMFGYQRGPYHRF